MRRAGYVPQSPIKTIIVPPSSRKGRIKGHSAKETIIRLPLIPFCTLALPENAKLLKRIECTYLYG